MKKLILMGRVAAGKTTLTQALKGEQLHYCKTQYINYYDTIIDTPGEYTEVHALGRRLPSTPMRRTWSASSSARTSRSAFFLPAVPPWSTGM